MGKDGRAETQTQTAGTAWHYQLADARSRMALRKVRESASTEYGF